METFMTAAQLVRALAHVNDQSGEWQSFDPEASIIERAEWLLVSDGNADVALELLEMLIRDMAARPCTCAEQEGKCQSCQAEALL